MLNIFNKPPHKLGIALSGGGARGFAHAGALMALEQAGFRPDIIAGVSAGSVVAAMYAAGMHPRAILEAFDGMKFSRLADFARPRGGFFRLDSFRKFLSDTIKFSRLEDLPIPTVIGTTDFDAGKTVNFRSGNIPTVISASCSIPIIFQPVEIGGTAYVDGGLLHNLPSRAIRNDCRTLIGINCSPVRPRNTERNGLVDTALRSYNLVAKSNAVPDLAICDLKISIDEIADFTVFDLSDTECIFSAGYNAALKALKANPDFSASSSLSRLSR